MRLRTMACLVLAAACSSSNHGSGFAAGNGNGSNGDNGGNTDDGGAPVFGAGDGGAEGCSGLQCQVHTCPDGGSTTISGTIYDPAGKNPLYDVVAYVPNLPPSPFKSGVSCDSCADLYTGDPVATALTDPTGKFTITNAPDGPHIPLVIQIGKWRKLVLIPDVVRCRDNPLPDRSLTLPKNHTEGDIPNIAISTGMADTLECLLRRVGVDAAEYSPGAGGAGHIHVFQGDGVLGGAPGTNPGAPDPATSLWDSDTDIDQFDIVILSCEGHETTSMNQQVLFDYAKAGGRVFGSHFHYAWFNSGPFASGNLATWSAGGNDMGNINATIVTKLSSGKPFPKGQALEQWLGTVNALTNDELPIQAARHNADVAAANTSSQSWIVADQNASPADATEYFTFDTPLGLSSDQQCGRVVFSDLHVGAASGDYANSTTPVTPDGCASNDLSPQEKALEFMLFDLSSCVTPNDQPPTAPPPVR